MAAGAVPDYAAPVARARVRVPGGACEVVIPRCLAALRHLLSLLLIEVFEKIAFLPLII